MYNKKKNIAKYLIYCIALLPLLQLSCKNGSDGGKKAVVVKEVKLIEIPSMMTDLESRSKYASEHFWDNFDFNDSTYLVNKGKLSEHLTIYLQVLSITERDIADRSLADFVNKITQSNTSLRAYFFEEVENILYDPNSTDRNEDLYISFLKYLIASQHIGNAQKEKYTFHLNMAMKNLPGDRAIDFRFVDSKNRLSSLYQTKGEYILLFFYEPGCPSCKEIKQGIEESQVFGKMEAGLTYLAVYSGEDYVAWEESVASYPSDWIVAHDIGQELLNDNLYDLRASPTIYLLNKEHKVLLKDPDLFQLENYLSSLQ